MLNYYKYKSEETVRILDDLIPVLNARSFRAPDGAPIIIGKSTEGFAPESHEGFLSLAFPHLFYDDNCLDIDSKNTLATVCHLIRFVSPKYQADPFLIFYLFNRWRREKTSSHISFKLFSSFSKLYTILESVKPEDLLDPNSPIIKRLESTITNLTSTQKGTKGWKLQGRRKATSLHRLCGPPAIFLTVSSPEVHCLLTSLYIQRRRALLDDPTMDAHLITTESAQVSQVPFNQRRLLCSNHPGEVARAFSVRLEALVYCLKHGLLGIYEASFLEVEYQQRGG